jgi:leader peptidase (prepilin peptidase)/N-methyltransferase
MSIEVLDAWVGPVLIVTFGLLVGSFLNVVIYRRPRDQSVVWPGSRCPGCAKALGALENIPVLSFVMQKGRCRSCAMPISWRYPLNEVATSLLFLLVYWHFGMGIQLIFLCVLMALLIVTFWIDIDHMVILDEVMVPGIVIGLSYSATVNHNFLLAVAGALAGASILIFINSVTLLLIGRDGIGEGDFLLIAMLGTWLGLGATGVALVLAVLAGAVIGLALLFFKWYQARVWQPFLCASLVGIVTYVASWPVVMYWKEARGLSAEGLWGSGSMMQVSLGVFSVFLGACGGWLMMKYARDDGFLEMPFGPSLVLGGVGALFYGQDVTRLISNLYSIQ